MLIRAASFGFFAETPSTSRPGVVLAEPRPPVHEDDAAIIAVYGSVRVAAADIEVERTEILRCVQLVLVLGSSQVSSSAPLAAPAVIFPDDIEDIAGDLVGSFRCELVLPARMGPSYLHAAFRHHVSNVVRVHPAQGAR
jgi:hypothetical protein